MPVNTEDSGRLNQYRPLITRGLQGPHPPENPHSHWGHARGCRGVQGTSVTQTVTQNPVGASLIRRVRLTLSMRHDPLYLLAYLIVFIVLVYVLLRVANAV